MQKGKFQDLICEDPYRLFFPLGIFLGAVGIGHWLLYALHLSHTYSGFFHSNLQMQAYMASFVIGFLTTSMPRLTSSFHATPREIFVFLILILGVWGFSSFKLWIFSEMCFSSMLIWLAIFALRRFSQRKSIGSPPIEFVWVFIAILHGVLGSAILILAQIQLIPIRFLNIGKLMADQGFLVAIVLGVGGFLTPRLMGTFSSLRLPDHLLPQEIVRIRLRRVLTHLGAGFLFLTGFCLEGLGAKLIGQGLRAVVVTFILSWSRSWPKTPRAPDMYVWLIWVSMWMIFLGHWAQVIFQKYRVEMLHLVFIGGLSLLTFSVATMVAMSHAGESEKLKRPLWVLWVVLIGMVLAMIFRIAAPFIPRAYFPLIGAAAAFWLVAGMSWLIFIFLRIFKIPDDSQFERFHEEAKKRIAELNGQTQKNEHAFTEGPGMSAESRKVK